MFIAFFRLRFLIGRRLALNKGEKKGTSSLHIEIKYENTSILFAYPYVLYYRATTFVGILYIN